jgi:glycyl-tRNA synthetase
VTEKPAEKSMEQIVALCKRRGFVFQASEIYGGINGFWDFGPLGVLLKNNLRDAWWKDMVISSPLGPDGKPLSIVGIDTAIIQHPKTWIASGHVAGFNDPMQTCRQCKKLFRADHVPDMLRDSEWVQSLVQSALAGGTLDVRAARAWAEHKGKKLAPGLPLVRQPALVVEAIAARAGDAAAGVEAAALLSWAATESATAALVTPCPNCGGDLTEPRLFNLMFETNTGAVRDEDNRVYLRPETAQGIFLNFKNVLDTTRVKVPFGIAQIGKAFRNEVTPRNFIFRSREFEQMEMEWFCHPDEAREWYEFWCAERLRWWRSLGVADESLRLRPHDADELSHYAKAGAGTSDVEYRYPFTAPEFGELEGIAHRTDFDLKAHQEHSGVRLDYFDQERNLRYVPHVIEPAAGLTRGMLVLLCEAFTPDASRASGVYLNLHPRVAPIKAGIFPLVAKEGMPEIAEQLYLDLRKRHTIDFDAKQSIGKRYARMDEAGTPFCFTIDGETLRDRTVTVRFRDTLAQERIGLDHVAAFLAERIGG